MCCVHHTRNRPSVLAVKYDDGDIEELDLGTEKFELVTRSKKKAAPSAPKLSQKKALLQKVPKKSANHSAPSEEGLEDSDVESASESEGSEYGVMDEADVSEDEDMDVDESEEDSSDADEDAESDDGVLVPRKRPAKGSQKTPTVQKKAKKSAGGAQQHSPSENVDAGNGANMHTPTIGGKPAGSSGVVSTGNLRDVTPRAGQLFGRLSVGTPAAGDLVPGGARTFTGSKRYLLCC